MQTRPYDTKDGSRIWLSRSEQQALLDTVGDDPRRRIAMQLGLNGLRTDEIVSVQPSHVRSIEGGTAVLVVPDGKTGKREVPIDEDLRQRMHYLKQADSGLTASDPIVDKSRRTIRNWMDDIRSAMGEDYGGLGMHDLRRTWATDTYYSLAFEGVPIAEQLTMSWGGWKQTSTGRETFRQNYLGPVPDHITAEVQRLLQGDEGAE